MKLIEFIIGLVVAGTIIAWLSIGIILLVSLFTKMSNKAMEKCFLSIAILFFICSLAIVIMKGHYDSVFWWLFGIIFGLSAGFNFMIFDDTLNECRCFYCNSWGLNSCTLTEASFRRDGVTTSHSRMSSDGKAKIIIRTHTDKGLKTVKVHRQLTMCHCKKCERYYEMWETGHPTNEKGPFEIPKERFEKSIVRHVCSNELPLSKQRIKNSCEESFIYLYGDENNDRDIFPEVIG